MEVEKLKLLKGRFDPKTLVTGKNGRADCLIRHRKHMHLQSHKFFIRATQSHPPFTHLGIKLALSPYRKRVKEHRMAASQLIPLPSGGSTKDSSDDIRVMSDENLVAVAKNGRRLAFDELHNRHGRKMFRVAHRITRNREDAEDAVQECFLNAFVHLESFDGRSKFLTWLTRIATNAALMKRRKNRASREVPVKGPAEAPDFLIEDALADPLSNPEERLAKSERETILRDAIAKLRPSLRKVIEVYQLQESPLPETAEILGISIAATKARMFHARAALRRATKLQFIGPSITRNVYFKIAQRHHKHRSCEYTTSGSSSRPFAALYG